MKKYFLLLFITHALLSSAQTIVAVKDEPRHHNVFENAYVRILDVRINPGDTTQFHKHATPSVFIVLHPVKTGSEVKMEEQKATALSSPDPSITFEGFYKSPRIHRVWNEDTAQFHVMDIELLNKEPHPIAAPMQQNTMKLLFDEQPVRGYKLTLNAGENFKLQMQSPMLVVGLTNVAQPLSVNKTLFSKEGNFLFVPAGQSVQFDNINQATYSFAVIAFK